MRALEILGLLAAGGTCGWGGRVATGLLGAYLWRRRHERFGDDLIRAARLEASGILRVERPAPAPILTRAAVRRLPLASRRATEWGYTLRPGRRHLVLRREHAYALCGASVLLVTCEPILPGDERPYPDECKRCHAIDLARGSGPK